MGVIPARIAGVAEGWVRQPVLFVLVHLAEGDLPEVLVAVAGQQRLHCQVHQRLGALGHREQALLGIELDPGLFLVGALGAVGSKIGHVFGKLNFRKKG